MGGGTVEFINKIADSGWLFGTISATGTSALHNLVTLAPDATRTTPLAALVVIGFIALASGRVPPVVVVLASACLSPVIGTESDLISAQKFDGEITLCCTLVDSCATAPRHLILFAFTRSRDHDLACQFDAVAAPGLRQYALQSQTDCKVAPFECLVPSRLTHFGFAVELYLLARNLDQVPLLPVAAKYDADSIGERALSALLPSKGGAYRFVRREVVQRRIGRLCRESRTHEEYRNDSLEDSLHGTAFGLVTIRAVQRSRSRKRSW